MTTYRMEVANHMASDTDPKKTSQTPHNHRDKLPNTTLLSTNEKTCRHSYKFSSFIHFGILNEFS